MRRALLFVFLAACTAHHTDDSSTSGDSSDLTTDVLATNVDALEVGPNGELKVVDSSIRQAG